MRVVRAVRPNDARQLKRLRAEGVPAELNNTLVRDNVCHDVRAYMSGGYCLSQDQGSSNLIFVNFI